MALVLPSHAELRSTQNEAHKLTAVATTVTRIQDRLADILRRSEDEARSLHDRTVELESDSRDMTRELQGVWALNSELQEAAEKYNHPETDRAVDARDAALKKLHRARKVIYDLLQERRIGLDPEFGGPSVLGPLASLDRGQSGTIADADAALRLLLEGVSVFSRTSSNETVRPIRAGSDQRAGTDVRRHSPRSSRGQGSPTGSHTISSTSQLSSAVVVPGPIALEPVGSPRSSAGPQNASSTSSSERGKWTLHYSRVPRSSVLVSPKMTWAQVAERLKLQESEMENLEGLAENQAHGLRVQKYNDVIFVHDPIVLEGQSVSYLIDWGNKRTNKRAKGYIRGKPEDPPPVLHTFLYPVKTGTWYYIGAMTWKPIDLWAIWPTLSTKSRGKLTSKLRDRCKGTLDRDQITSMLEEGTLEQICVQVSGGSWVTESHDFARDIGYVTPRGAQPRIEM